LASGSPERCDDREAVAGEGEEVTTSETQPPGLLERLMVALEKAEVSWRRIADVFDPPPTSIEKLNLKAGTPREEE
jgi:hypothetical protein